MCGRFNVIDNPALQALLVELGIDLSLPSRSNIAPTESIALVRNTGSPELVELRWWLTPGWARQVNQKYAMFNARAEGLETSRAFAAPFSRQRGIVPLSSFIEWRTESGAKQPYLIEAEAEALAVAAVWERWQGEEQVVESCALVTVEADPEFQQIHRRMPLMLVGEERQRWLDAETPPAANDPLFAPMLKLPLRATPISRGVNNARNKELELLEPVGEPLEFGR
ncbi:MAG: SOS response-associated peptidase [Pseudomonadota bacterium]